MDSSELNRNWNSVCEQVKTYSNVDASQVNAFFSRLVPQAMSEGFLILTADNDFIKSWVEQHYLDVIKQALNDLFQVPFNVIIAVDEAAGAAQPKPTAAPIPQTPAATAHTPAATFQAPTPELQTSPQAFQAPASSPQKNAGGTYTIPNNPMPSSLDFSISAAHEAVMRNAAGSFPKSESQNASSIQPGQDSPQPFDEGFTHSSDFDYRGEEEKASAPHKRADGPASLTFENFVIGDSNRMAYSMAVDVAETPGKMHLNPLFIYGKSGLGKTHLLRAIQNYINETRPQLKVTYVDSAELLSDYMEASVAHDKEKASYRNFKQRYEESDVLLIDDVQYFQGKKQTLDIVFQIFNKMTDQGKQVVLSADRAPKNIDIDERYITRFNSGGTFDIQPPEIETKLGIVKSFIEEYRESEGDPTFSISNDIQMYIAENSGSNIRELKSAVTKIIYQMAFTHNSDLTLDDVRGVLESHFSGGPTKRLAVADIQREVENYYKISHSDMVGKKRPRHITYARKIAMYLCRQMLDLPFNDIGKKFNRDHTTVLYSVSDVEKQLKESRDMNEEIEALKMIIRDL